jgi:hypothetical protein
MNYKALTVGAVLGFLLALSPSCGGGGDRKCDEGSCPTGCCDSSGRCVTATTPAQCGTRGQDCVPCPTGQSCQAGSCTVVPPPPPDGGCGCPLGCCQSGICFPGNDPPHCGKNGDPCQQCTTGQECVAVFDGTVLKGGECRVRSNPDPYGAACDSRTQCTAVPVQNPANRLCKMDTTFHNLPYPGGYCTRRCTEDLDCGDAGLCMIGFGRLGEGDNICLDRCGSNSECRPGYACFNFGGEGACWVRTLDGGTLHELVDAGPGANADVMGGPCLSDVQCEPPADGFCLAEFVDGGSTGFVGGSCTADCTYGGQEHCGSGGACVLFEFGSDPETVVIPGLCMRRCVTTASTCRTGYVCTPYFSSTEGFCFPP